MNYFWHPKHKAPCRVTLFEMLFFPPLKHEDTDAFFSHEETKGRRCTKIFFHFLFGCYSLAGSE